MEMDKYFTSKLPDRNHQVQDDLDRSKERRRWRRKNEKMKRRRFDDEDDDGYSFPSQGKNRF